MSAMFRGAVAVWCLVIVSPLAATAGQDLLLPPQEGHWRLLLSTQLKDEKGCDLNEVLLYQEVPLGDDVGLDGRISCADGREFTFTRKRKDQKFSFELCAPTVC